MKDRSRSIKEKTIAEYESKEQYPEAAKIASELGLTEKSQALWKKELTKLIDRTMKYGNSWCESASNAALKTGDKKLALELRIKSGHYDSDSLGEFAEKNELYEEAIEFFKRSRDNKVRAARAAEKAGNLEKALEIYIKEADYMDDFISAARIAKQLGYTETSKDLYEKAINYEEQSAEKYYSREKNNQDKKFEHAAKIAIEAGDIDRAISLYRKTRYNHERTFELAKEHGKIDTAIEICSGDNPEWLDQAAKLAEENNRLREAMKLYSRSLELRESKWDFLGAARIAKHLGLEKKAREDYEKARISFEKRGNWKSCLEIAKETEDKERVEVYETLLKISSEK